jgi:hypothetical protein
MNEHTTPKVALCKSSLALLLIAYTTGCTSSHVDHLSSGYREVTYGYRSLLSEPDRFRTELRHRDTNGKEAVIWPSASLGALINDDVALFMAEPPERLLFTIRSPGPLLEISGPVLRQWCQNNGKDYAEVSKSATFVSYEQKDNGVEFYWAFWNREHWPEGVILNWNQIFQIMNEVKAKGIAHQDAHWGRTYLAE